MPSAPPTPTSELDGLPPVGMGPHTPSSLADVLATWTAAPDPVTALVTGNNRVTVAMLRALRALHSPPGLRRVRRLRARRPAAADRDGRAPGPRCDGSGGGAAALRQDQGEDGPPRSVTVPTHLIVRESSSLRVPTEASA